MNVADASTSAILRVSVRGRRVLLLQGPVGTFFGDLRHALAEAGAQVEHVLFNAADALFAKRRRRVRDTVTYKGSEEGWSDFLRERIAARNIEAVVLFGCERDRHAVARAVCAEHGLPVLSLEEGYVRPGYVTAEWGGNNRRSPLADASMEALREAARGPVPSGLDGNAFSRMAATSTLYYILRAAGASAFPQAVHHRDRPLHFEAVAWLRSGMRKVSHASTNRRTIDTLLEHHRDEYVLVALQVSDDMQLVKAGRGWTTRALVGEGIASFAAHAPSHRRLVFKIHPLQRGHSQIGTTIRELARSHGVENRVDVIDDGSIGLLARSACAMLTINSTSAFSAMAVGVPVGVLGDAMFRRPDTALCLDDGPTLDAFWTASDAFDTRGARTLRAAMVRTALLPGDFYLPHLRTATVQSVIAKLAEGLDEPSPAGPRDHREAVDMPKTRGSKGSL